MNVVDYKHGKGVEVSAENNPQMMLYALGALEIFDCIYDIDEIRLTIFQPRLGNISVGGMNKAALLEWADGELKERAKLAYEGGGEYACGEWCRFCRAKAVCRNGTEENLKMARYDFAPADTLDETEIAAILDRADELASWVTDVKDYALSQALQGVKYPGYKVVEGRSARKYSNEELAANVVPVVGLSAQIVLCLHSVLRARTAFAPRPGKTLHRTVLFPRLRVPFDLTKHRGTQRVPLCLVPVVGLSAQIVLCLHSVLRARTAFAPRPGKTLHRTVLFPRLRVPFDLTKHRGTQRVPLCLVPVVGLEPTRYCYQRILSPSRLPIPSHRRICSNFVHISV